MYPSIHSLAHRAPPATRTRVRWQPYSSLPTSASASSFTSRSPSSTYLNTPASSVSSSPSPIPSRTCDSERAKIPQQRDPTQSREKNKYALSLVDQAVKSLHEIWHPQDIPVVFLTSSRAMVPGTTTDNSPPCNFFNSQSSSTQLRNNQLPSPISPTTHPSPPNSSPAPSVTQCNDSLEALLNPRNMVPIKGFVHEVLRRSRTSGSVLQTALCYLEAIRGKVPELIRQEKAGEGLKGELELDSRITPATEAELELEALSSANSSCSSGLPTLLVSDAGDFMDTVKVLYSDDVGPIDTSSTSANAYGIGEVVAQSWVEDDTLKKPKSTGPSLAPLPPLPSPLLCPRRAFLAALILASKFTQDKCYSNRAWAKLSGLPPREIGRCERALGDALDWRLWVGKSPAQSSPATSASTPSVMPSPSSTPPVCGSGNSRPVSRCQSESNLRSSASERSTFLATDKASSHQRTAGPVSARPLATRSGSGLRRASTLPAEVFASSSSPASSSFASHGSRMRSNNVVAQWISGQSHADRIDQEMYSPEVETMKSEFETPASVTTSTHVTCPSSSPCPPTPGLSYSPSTTESSLESGDRTIQMSAFASFEEVAASGSFGSVGSFNSHLGGGCGVTGVTPWMGSSSPVGISSIVNHIPDCTYVPQLKLAQPSAYFKGYSNWSGREIGLVDTAVGTFA